MDNTIPPLPKEIFVALNDAPCCSKDNFIFKAYIMKDDLPEGIYGVYRLDSTAEVEIRKIHRRIKK